mgnify:CR=1 FL=1
MCVDTDTHRYTAGMATPSKKENKTTHCRHTLMRVPLEKRSCGSERATSTTGRFLLVLYFVWMSAREQHTTKRRQCQSSVFEK